MKSSMNWMSAEWEPKELKILGRSVGPYSLLIVVVPRAWVLGMEMLSHCGERVEDWADVVREEGVGCCAAARGIKAERT